MGNLDLPGIKNRFIKELSDAKKGKQTSLPFIPHTLATKSIVDQNEVFQVIVIGGSIYQKALMKKINGNIKILEYMQDAQPPFLTENDLLLFIDKILDPHVRVVALNFAYPLEPITRGNLLDGILKSGSKENTFTGLVGKVIGQRIEEYIKEKQGRDIQVASANDTICLLLSGLIHNGWAHLAAGIVGTGLNFAIFLDETTTVNLESANFKGFPQSEAAKFIDSQSAEPGDALYEKEVSGAYLYRHFNYAVEHTPLKVDPVTSTKELENLLKHPDPAVAQAAKDVLLHSASLVACQIAAILEFCGRDLNFIMQGSLYWKGYKYKETVERLVIDLSPHYHASYEQVLHSDLFGAAKIVA